MINDVVDMRSSMLKHEKLNEIKNIVGFVENCTVSEKTFRFLSINVDNKIFAELVSNYIWKIDRNNVTI